MTETFNQRLDSIAESIRRSFAEKDAAREKALPLCREAIRHCSESIRSIHRRQFADAKGSLAKAKALIDEGEATIKSCEELSNTSFFRDAQKEYSEGSITLAITMGEPIPTPEILAVDSAAYLNGMGEVVGELRRYILDGMRSGDLSRAEELLSDMDSIYEVLVTMDFPDAITGSLRRTTDMVRGILEKTRSDLTLTLQQKRLEERLDKFSGQFER
ncbi:haloacid dehalogenase [Dehalogenimonas etheniformans]|uniref:Haloacid dehalogenase n=1 Tax=Dehalogenimonas etheniformans TaxID=1536648 RepID=A0A2P5P984_9CHLR|nr:haloacid dehalogenase [Dehalogenimonas etheniformans]PPD58862.1 haloacid dehalogenase [Dehalogenimonas etheniformans]QNT76370.1 haloacid dehalogenase [Dehalogenimonas etheniformans]